MRTIYVAHYLTLPIAGAVLALAVTLRTPAVHAQATPNPMRGKHNGKIVFISDRSEVKVIKLPLGLNAGL